MEIHRHGPKGTLRIIADRRTPIVDLLRAICSIVHRSGEMIDPFTHIRVPTFVAILLLLPLGTMGQAYGTEASIHVGPSLSWLRGNRVIDGTDALLGPAAALNVTFGLTEQLGLRTGVGYQRKGTQAVVLFTDANGATLAEGELLFAYDYLMIPVMLRASFGSKARLHVGLGPYAGYLIKSQLLTTGYGNDRSIETTDDHKAWDLGISASLGGSIPLGERLSLQAEVRYDKGLTNISALPLIDDGIIRTNAVALLVGCGYLFGGGAKQAPAVP